MGLSYTKGQPTLYVNLHQYTLLVPHQPSLGHADCFNFGVLIGLLISATLIRLPCCEQEAFVELV